MLVIDDAILARMASDSRFTSWLPFMAAAAQAGGCGCSGTPRVDTNSIKQQLASLDADSKRRLKNLLQADKVRIIYRNPAGRLVQLTF